MEKFWGYVKEGETTRRKVMKWAEENPISLTQRADQVSFFVVCCSFRSLLFVVCCSFHFYSLLVHFLILTCFRVVHIQTYRLIKRLRALPEWSAFVQQTSLRFGFNAVGSDVLICL